MTYREALKAPTRPLCRTLGRALIDTCHVLLLVGVMTLPASLATAWKDFKAQSQRVTQK